MRASQEKKPVGAGKVRGHSQDIAMLLASLVFLIYQASNTRYDDGFSNERSSTNLDVSRETLMEEIKTVVREEVEVNYNDKSKIIALLGILGLSEF